MSIEVLSEDFRYIDIHFLALQMLPAGMACAVMQIDVDRFCGMFQTISDLLSDALKL